MNDKSSLNLNQEVLTALRRVIRATDMHSKHLAKTSSLTAPQIILMQAIEKNGALTVSELASQMSLSQATVTTILDRLEKRELIYRERSSQDKRKVHARLSEKARPLLAQAPAPLQESFTRQFSRLQEWEQLMILAALQRVAEMMNAPNLDDSPMLDLGTLDTPGSATSL